MYASFFYLLWSYMGTEEICRCVVDQTLQINSLTYCTENSCTDRC